MALTVRRSISRIELHKYIEFVAESYFYTDETGNESYTPYLADEALHIGFLMFCVENLPQDVVENIYERFDDPDLKSLFDSHKTDSLIEYVKSSARDIADYEKERRTHLVLNKLNALIDMMTEKVRVIDTKKAMSFVEKLADSQITPDNIVRAYLNTDLHQQNQEESGISKKEKVENISTRKRRAKTKQEENKS